MVEAQLRQRWHYAWNCYLKNHLQTIGCACKMRMIFGNLAKISLSCMLSLIVLAHKSLTSSALGRCIIWLTVPYSLEELTEAITQSVGWVGVQYIVAGDC